MKVLMINGSRREHGCTYTALCEVAKSLKEQGIDSEILYIGAKVVQGQVNEAVQEVREAMKEADGLILGSPVYYASPSGEIEMLCDRLFFGLGNEVLRFKPAAAVVSARRGGTTAAFDALNKYFTITQMPVVSSRYWNMVHGNSPEEVRKDEEGMEVMRVLGYNMAWLLKSIEAGKQAGVPQPEAPRDVWTNFIR